jgi:uncharacterized membrane protein YebE (DUF533 family)
MNSARKRNKQFHGNRKVFNGQVVEANLAASGNDCNSNKNRNSSVLIEALSGTTGGALIGSVFGVVGGIAGGIIAGAITGYSGYHNLRIAKHRVNKITGVQKTIKRR